MSDADIHYGQQHIDELKRQLAVAVASAEKAEAVFELRRERLKDHAEDLNRALVKRTKWLGLLLQALGQYRTQHVTARYRGRSAARGCRCACCKTAEPIFAQASREHWSWAWEGPAT